MGARPKESKQKEIKRHKVVLCKRRNMRRETELRGSEKPNTLNRMGQQINHHPASKTLIWSTSSTKKNNQEKEKEYNCRKAFVPTWGGGSRVETSSRCAKKIM